MNSPFEFDFEDFGTSAAGDGASCLVGVNASRMDAGAEAGELMNAWYSERAERIECLLLLEQARKIIASVLAETTVTPRDRRRARNLIRAIRILQGRNRND